MLLGLSMIPSITYILNRNSIVNMAARLKEPIDKLATIDEKNQFVIYLLDISEYYPNSVVSYHGKDVNKYIVYCVWNEFKYIYNNTIPIQEQIKVAYEKGINPFFLGNIYTGYVQKIMKFLQGPFGNSDISADVDTTNKFTSEYMNFENITQQNLIQTLADLIGLRVMYIDCNTNSSILTKGEPICKYTDKKVLKSFNSSLLDIVIANQGTNLYALAATKSKNISLSTPDYGITPPSEELSHTKIQRTEGSPLSATEIVSVADHLYTIYGIGVPDTDDKLERWYTDIRSLKETNLIDKSNHTFKVVNTFQSLITPTEKQCSICKGSPAVILCTADCAILCLKCISSLTEFTCITCKKKLMKNSLLLCYALNKSNSEELLEEVKNLDALS